MNMNDDKDKEIIKINPPEPWPEEPFTPHPAPPEAPPEPKPEPKDD
jgi:hypothetical protein